jgi:hypothetical protein
MRWLKTLAALVTLCVVGGSVRAQSNPPFKNPALDSNCYFPQIGDLSEMDTIYGDTASEGLGDFIHNLGPNPNGTPGNVLLGTLGPFNSLQEPTKYFSIAPTGASFNLHSLKAKAQAFLPDITSLRFGHFHNRTNVDIFDADNWVIYWADADGNYDSTRSTRLVSNVRGSNGLTRFDDDILSQAFIAHLSSDTVDDIVVGMDTSDSIQTKDSSYLELFKGGPTLFGPTIVHEDTSILIAPLFPYIHQLSHYSVQGDFRGTGREDLIIADESRNAFFFKNDPPFSLQNFLQSMLFDTLWTKPSRWRDSNINNQRIYWIDPFESRAMHALPKKKSDSSYDWTIWIPTRGDTQNGIFIFRGGPDFGSHRITIDSAAFVILPPKLGETNWPDFFSDAGDMTGTGNHVLYVAADDGVVAYQNFYVTGQALDNKIDIYNTTSAGAVGDTLTANEDTLEDFLMGLPYFQSDYDAANRVAGRGSIWLMYGSEQIPVHLNPQWAEVKTELEKIPKENGAGITFAPNPTTHSWSVATIIWPVSEEADLCVYDLLGTAVQTEKIRLLGGPEQQRIYFPNLAAGVYVVEIHGMFGVARAKLVMVH